MALKNDWANGDLFTPAAANDMANAVNNVNFMLNVKDYGAVGNGSTADATAIQAAINAVPAAGGTVYFPAGTYIIPKTIGLLCSKSNVRFLGESSGSILKYSLVSGATKVLLDIDSASNVSVEGITFDGNAAVMGGFVPTMLRIKQSSNVYVRGCRFVNSTGAGLALTDAASVWITGNYFKDLNYSGINLALTPAVGVYNENIWITDNYLDDCQLSAVSGNAAIQVRSIGLHRNIHVLNNTVLNFGKVGIGMDNVSRSNISGNTVITDYIHPTNPYGECIVIGGSENIVSGNFCRNNSKSFASCILVYAGTDPAVDAPPAVNIQILNNRCTFGAAGIDVVFAVNSAVINGLTIQNNHCYDNSYGIRSFLNTSVTSGIQSNVNVSGNILTDNTTATSLLNNSGGVTGSVAVFESANVQTFTANGTWTKPAGAKSVHVRCIGPGGAGGSGARGPSGTALAGGGGGGAGGITEMTFPASDLTATVAVTTSVGGTAATGQTSDGTAGANGGTPGQQSTFGAYLRATRGGGGTGGGLAAGGGAGAAGVGIIGGQAGAAGSTSGAVGGTAPTTGAGPGGGGAGGGITTGGTANAGSAGGAPTAATALTAGTAGSAANGGAGVSSSGTGQASGGGGGGANAAGAGYNGGAGGSYGAGGGGGGASLDGNTSGAGGAGGPGIVIVTTYF